MDNYDVEPRQLTVRDKAELSVSFALTLARVAGLLGAALGFAVWAFRFNPVPLFWGAGFLALYVVSTTVLFRLHRLTMARIHAERA